MMSIEHKVELTGKAAEVFKRAKEIFSQYWLKNLQKLGIKRMMKNFTRDYPVQLLQYADADHFIEQIVEICSDPEQFDKVFMQFYDMTNRRRRGSILQSLTQYNVSFVKSKLLNRGVSFTLSTY